MGGGEAGGPRDGGGNPVVCDASPLIALAQIGRLHLLRDVFGAVIVPPAVTIETPRVAKPEWLAERPPRAQIPTWLGEAGLGPGETEAIALALELHAPWLVLDERRATGLARASGLHVIGTLGILLLSKSAGLLPSVRPAIDDLLATGFHLAPWLVTDALSTAGEGP